MGIDIQCLDVLNNLHAPGVRRIRMGGVQGVNVREQDEGLCAHQLGHQGRKPIVVAEANLPGGDRVILIDDRHDSQPQ